MRLDDDGRRAARLPEVDEQPGAVVVERGIALRVDEPEGVVRSEHREHALGEGVRVRCVVALLVVHPVDEGGSTHRRVHDLPPGVGRLTVHRGAELVGAEDDDVVRLGRREGVGHLAGLATKLGRQPRAGEKRQRDDGHERPGSPWPGQTLEPPGDREDERRQDDRAVARGVRAPHQLADQRADDKRRERDTGEDGRRLAEPTAEEDAAGRGDGRDREHQERVVAGGQEVGSRRRCAAGPVDRRGQRVRQ